MNVRFLNIMALIGCGCYLAGNISYDILYNEGKEPSPLIFYIPLSVMIFTLILLCKDYAKKQRDIIYPFWWFFTILAAGQVVKFLIFSPYLQLVSDYGFLAMALIGLLYKLYKLKK